MIPLTKLQNELMKEFYERKPTKVIYNKKQRNILWKIATSKNDLDFESLKIKCPALAHQCQKSYSSGKNIQSAVFSECVYAQTFANMFELNIFNIYSEKSDFISNDIKLLLKSYNLVPRYIYSNSKKSRMLIQAGGCSGIDSALITVLDLNIYTIEFKEPGAKASEPDLPKYKEDGNLNITEDFIKRYPQFKLMLEEKKHFNFFNKMGSNENSFSAESVNIAVSENYTKKYADVVCTEDKNGYLVMLPINQLHLWAEIIGEIRPSGRNHYNVWTPNALKKFIIDKNGKIEDNLVRIEKSKLNIRKERGGNGKISGYKINPLFFVYSNNCSEDSDFITFNISDVKQLNPTITAKIFFKKLKFNEVKNYYFKS